MVGFKIGIFWKLFLSILVSVICSFVIIAFLYIELTPTISLRPHIKSAILQESYRIAHRIEIELARLEEIFSTQDALEGLTSAGKRRPNYIGK